MYLNSTLATCELDVSLRNELSYSQPLFPFGICTVCPKLPLRIGYCKQAPYVVLSANFCPGGHAYG
ncbi:hypothetical protein NECAME_17894 [Necator americanus]|uniref:Uncharacterized protein n=1 Tax=Necator americanus TaxID=51031 RepID=W2TK11_NECAM|nr:hypothetical protein NECAME_17894 [Necator americanus]ETN81516.1 hypothetical protein NECAME_17894 [Necator americanus]